MAERVPLSPLLQQWFVEGMKHLEAERWPEAEAVFRRIIAQRPDVAEAHYNLGGVLKRQRRLEEAVTEYRMAVAMHPSFADGWNNLGITLRHLHRLPEAIEAFQQALAGRPGFPDAYINMGTAFRESNRAVDSVDAYRRALQGRPNSTMAWNSLGVALKDIGQVDESIACFAHAAALDPADSSGSSARLCTIYFHPGFDSASILRAAQEWNARFAAPFRGRILPHANEPAPLRRLRIGYISPDFRGHCQALFTTPLFAHHDHRQFEIFCYASVTNPDSVTKRLQSQVDVWRDILGMKDDAAAELIRRDRIDILIDLTLHMAGTRMGVLTRKPAPVQVTWLGYPGTTGVEMIDYRLTDPRLDPVDGSETEIRNSKFEIRINDQNSNDPISNGPGDQPKPLGHSNIGSLEFDSNFEFRISNLPDYSELSVRLPDTFWCYDPRGMLETDMPETGPLPVLANGYTTFGCLNNFCKVTDGALALWARVMAAVPDSHLILLAPTGPPRQWVLDKLGVSPERVEFVLIQRRAAYMGTYRRIDLCLDTIPYNGHTTSLDAYWMGVPVVTRVGLTVVGRAGLSQLHNLGLLELVAWSDEEFVKIAVDWSRDLERLKVLRESLRARMEQSPLMDGPRFVRNLEAAYRQMWRIWCQGPGRQIAPAGG